MASKKGEKKVTLELPARLAEVVKQMLKVDELGARMAIVSARNNLKKESIKCNH